MIAQARRNTPPQVARAALTPWRRHGRFQSASELRSKGPWIPLFWRSAEAFVRLSRGWVRPPPEDLQAELVTFVAGFESEFFIEAVGVGTALVGR